MLERFSARRLRNPGYSLRAFARDLAISPSHLSEVLRERENLSPRVAARLTTRLGLSKAEADLFIAEVEANFGRSLALKDAARVRLKDLRKRRNFAAVTQATFEAITNWYHFALLELFRLPQGRTVKDPAAWAARKLGLNKIEIDGALQRLKNLNLLRNVGASYEPTNADVETSSNVSSAAVREFHEQILRKASLALHNQGVDQRSVNSLVLAFPREKYAEAAQALNDFCRQFNTQYSQDVTEADSVFCLGFQFFELTKPAADTGATDAEL